MILRKEKHPWNKISPAVRKAQKHIGLSYHGSVKTIRLHGTGAEALNGSHDKYSTQLAAALPIEYLGHYVPF